MPNADVNAANLTKGPAAKARRENLAKPIGWALKVEKGGCWTEKAGHLCGH